MANRKRPVAQNATPLMKRITEKKFTKADVARTLNVSQQNITNWLSRGIPPKHISAVARMCDLEHDEYLAEAGVLERSYRPKQGNLESAALTADFEALPPGLRFYVMRKARELRALYEGLPDWLRGSLSPPKDMERYRAWERDIEALIVKFQQHSGDE